MQRPRIQESENDPSKNYIQGEQTNTKQNWYATEPFWSIKGYVLAYNGNVIHGLLLCVDS
jgi:hypothetical protein